MNNSPMALTPAESTLPKSATRSTRWMLAGITALLLGALATALIAFGVGRYRDGQWPEPLPSMADNSTLTWGSSPVILGGCLVAVLGLVLLLGAILPGNKRIFAVDAGNGSDTRVSRAGIARLVEHRLDALDGVSTVRARLRRGRMGVQVLTPMRETAALRNRALREATAVLEENLSSPSPRINLHVRSLS